ncbi:WXG100 family type VII secretion target [Saccharopolyspora sp. NFXS83]|uniref:WXG100 family type VII secretion target n=1 Tax=Saccharopolyspora sp. NFXS83 TaxID=2993560 RepID=UPI00224B2B1B|nr:WXG100 family type VII secretion target [Saccharopolyspora sp. NFXS83]MCX2729704.1 WXG100 family type VII secretion target [Saccharopolyspora sp. NFXS83]
MALNVAPEALTAHGQGSEGVSQHLDQLSSVLEQARVSDDCFGPIGELLAFAYFDSLEECRDLAKQAGGFMSHMSSAVQDCAKDYQEMDQTQADDLGKIDLSGMRVSGGGPASLGAVNGAGGPGKSYMEQTAEYGSSAASTSGDLARADNPPDVAIATVNARMEQLQMVTSPGQSFMDNGLGFLVSLVISPLVEFVLEPAIGDPEQMRSTGKGWEQVAEWLEKLGEQEKQRAEATKPLWEGQAGDAFRKQLDEFSGGASAFASEVRGLTQILNMAADIFDMFVEMAIDIIQELVIGLIIEWIAALAASWITAGASVGAASGLTASQVAITGTRLGTKVAELLHKLKPLVTKLEELLKQLRSGPLRKVVEKMNDLRGGNMAQQWVARQIDANPLAKMVTRGDTDGVRNAQRGVREAEEALAQGRPGAQADLNRATRDLERANAQDMASTTGNRYANQARTDHNGDVIYRQDSNGNPVRSWGGDLQPEMERATGEQALATNAVQAGLGAAGLSGEHRWQDAVVHEGSAAVAQEGIEQGVKYGYDKAQDPSSSEDRQAATESGFSV